MGIWNGCKQFFGFDNASDGTSHQAPSMNPTTGYSMAPGTLHDVGGNNIGTAPSSNFDDSFGSNSFSQSFDMSFGSSDFDSF